MGISEILVILVVAVLLTKPEDIPKIAKKIRQVRKYFRNLKSDIASHFDLGEEKFEDQDHDKINYYLEKIASHGQTYDGEYDLDQIKKYFNSIISKKIKSPPSDEKL